MIKIKDYIFNENDIGKIMSVKKEENKSNFDKLYVFFKNENIAAETFYDTTFDDIEWNYEDEQIRKCLDSIDREEELEEENKKLNELVQFNVKTTVTLTKRINKAINYIEQYKEIYYPDEPQSEPVIQYNIGIYDEEFSEEKLIKILKGEENEN